MRRGQRIWQTALLAAIASVLALPVASHAAEVTLASGTFVKFSHKNGLGSLPESSVIYRAVPYAATADAHTVIRGRAPEARLFAFSMYESGISPIDVLPDRDIHVRRDGRYRITVREDCGDARNCLDGSKAPNQPLADYGLLIMRLYLPSDLGAAETGGVPLPEVTYVAGGPNAALDLSALQLPLENPVLEGALAAAMDAVREISRENGPFPEKVARPDNEPRPVFRALKNTKDAMLGWLGERGVPAPVTDAARAASLPLLDAQFAGVNTYFGSTFDLARGNLVIRFKAPTYRRSAWGGRPQNDLSRRNGKEQLRYWSVCAYKATFVFEFGCMRDSLFKVRRGRRTEVVIAPRCPVKRFDNCIASGSSTIPDFLVLVRNTLPTRAFAKQLFTGPYRLRARYVPRR